MKETSGNTPNYDPSQQLLGVEANAAVLSHKLEDPLFVPGPQDWDNLQAVSNHLRSRGMDHILNNPAYHGKVQIVGEGGAVDIPVERARDILRKSDPNYWMMDDEQTSQANQFVVTGDPQYLPDRERYVFTLMYETASDERRQELVSSMMNFKAGQAALSDYLQGQGYAASSVAPQSPQPHQPAAHETVAPVRDVQTPKPIGTSRKTGIPTGSPGKVGEATNRDNNQAEPSVSPTHAARRTQPRTTTDRSTYPTHTARRTKVRLDVDSAPQVDDNPDRTGAQSTPDDHETAPAEDGLSHDLVMKADDYLLKHGEISVKKLTKDLDISDDQAKKLIEAYTESGVLHKKYGIDGKPLETPDEIIAKYKAQGVHLTHEQARVLWRKDRNQNAGNMRPLKGIYEVHKTPLHVYRQNIDLDAINKQRRARNLAPIHEDDRGEVLLGLRQGLYQNGLREPGTYTDQRTQYQQYLESDEFAALLNYKRRQRKDGTKIIYRTARIGSSRLKPHRRPYSDAAIARRKQDLLDEYDDGLGADDARARINKLLDYPYLRKKMAEVPDEHKDEAREIKAEYNQLKSDFPEVEHDLTAFGRNSRKPYEEEDAPEPEDALEDEDYDDHEDGDEPYDEVDEAEETRRERAEQRNQARERRKLDKERRKGRVADALKRTLFGTQRLDSVVSPLDTANAQSAAERDAQEQLRRRRNNAGSSMAGLVLSGSQPAGAKKRS